MKNLKSRLIMFVLLVGLVFSGYKIVDYFYTSYDEKQNFNNVEKLVESEYEDEKIQYNDFEILKKYKKVYEKNNDLVGWIKINDTNIDYPVMQTPEEEEYYIHRDFYGEYSSAGTLFVDLESNVQKPSDNILIYGHNMKTGKMFHDLLKYENESFYKNHKYIQFDTIYGNGTYEVIAAFRTHILTEKEDGFRYYQFFNAEDESAFNQYVSGCKALTGYTIDTDASYGDSLLTLSTCAYHTDNGRFVVVAKKLTP